MIVDNSTDRDYNVLYLGLGGKTMYELVCTKCGNMIYSASSNPRIKTCQYCNRTPDFEVKTVIGRSFNRDAYFMDEGKVAQVTEFLGEKIAEANHCPTLLNRIQKRYFSCLKEFHKLLCEAGRLALMREDHDVNLRLVFLQGNVSQLAEMLMVFSRAWPNQFLQSFIREFSPMMKRKKTAA